MTLGNGDHVRMLLPLPQMTTAAPPRPAPELGGRPGMQQRLTLAAQTEMGDLPHRATRRMTTNTAATMHH